LTGIGAANRFSYFAAAAVSRTSTQSSGVWDDVVDLNSSVTQLLEEKEKEEEEEEEDTGQDDIMPGSFEPAHREPSLPWTEVVSKNLDDFLTFLHVKYTLSLLLYRTLKDSVIGDWDM